MIYNFINIFGLIVSILLFIPEAVHYIKYHRYLYNTANKLFYASYGLIYLIALMLMVLPIGVGEFGFKSVGSFLIYIIGDTLLLLIYLTARILVFSRILCKNNLLAPAAAAGVFLLSGAALGHLLLAAVAIIIISLLIISSRLQKRLNRAVR